VDLEGPTELGRACTVDNEVPVDVVDEQARDAGEVSPSSATTTLRTSREVPVHAPVIGLKVNDT